MLCFDQAKLPEGLQEEEEITAVRLREETLRNAAVRQLSMLAGSVRAQLTELLHSLPGAGKHGIQVEEEREGDKGRGAEDEVEEELSAALRQAGRALDFGLGAAADGRGGGVRGWLARLELRWRRWRSSEGEDALAEKLHAVELLDGALDRGADISDLLQMAGDSFGSEGEGEGLGAPLSTVEVFALVLELVWRKPPQAGVATEGHTHGLVAEWMTRAFVS